MKHLLAALSFLFLSACVSNYSGLEPDFNLKGEAAEKEIRKFTFADHYMEQRLGAFEMGDSSGNLYYTDSLKPVIERVSPKALEQLRRDESWNTAWWILYGTAAAILIVELADGDKNWPIESQAAFWGLLGTSIGINYYRLSIMQAAAKQYNQDLRSKFTPQVTLRYPF